MPTVSQLINQQAEAVDGIAAQANEFLERLVDTANVSFSNGFNIDSLLPNSYEYSQVPNISFPVFSAVEPTIVQTTDPVPEAPIMSFSSVDDVAVPELTAVSPSLDLPATPSSTLPAAPGSAPTFTAPTLPDAPTISLPSVPTFASLALPDAPSINLPSFAGSLPIDDLLVPSNTFEFAEAQYQSVLLDPLKTKLLDNLVNGGYGIEPSDELAMFNRARDRAMETALERMGEARTNMAARGFPVPPGQLAVELDDIYQEMQETARQSSRDITLERSRLFVENRQFTIREVKELENILIGFHSSVQERALNAAKAAVEMSIAIYNTLLARFNARLDAYKAEAAAFADRIRGELAKAEIYRTQVEAKNVEVQMQRNLVEVYVAQLKGLEISVEIYKTRMEGANIQAQIERQRLEAFRAQVEAYTSQVQAKVAEFGMYRAQIEGQQARVNIYEAQVRAYSSQVAAAKTRSDIQIGRLQSESEQARIQLTNYQVQIAAFDARVRSLMDSGRLKVDIYRANVEQSRSLTDGYRANAELQQRGIEATVKQNTEISQLAISNAQAKLLATVEALRFKASSAQFGAESFYALLTAMTNTINTLAVQTETD